MPKNTASVAKKSGVNVKVMATKDIILSKAFSLFADKGFNGVSMRDLAEAVKITPAALYYHFPNKQTLFEETIEYAYTFRSRPAVQVLSSSETSIDPLITVESFILRLCERFYLDEEFRRLVQWSLLYTETDKNIRDILVRVVYESHFDRMVEFLGKNFPGCNAYKLTIFIFGMVMQNYFTLEVRKDHHGYDEKMEKPEVLAREIMDILQYGGLKKK